MKKLTLSKKYLITGTITALSGLHIGGNDAGLSIGSPDATVIKDPVSGKPYIPGSSLKGKMRSLIELREGTLGNRKHGAVSHGPTEHKDALAAQLFGTASNDENQRPSRIIVRDAHLLPTKEGDPDYSVVEIKTEVLIDRITAKAMPRTMERVPAGAQFGLDIVLNVFEEDPKDYIMDVFAALQLVQDDYLGGKGSRGSGQIQFRIEQVLERSRTWYQQDDVADVDKRTQMQASFPHLF